MHALIYTMLYILWLLRWFVILAAVSSWLVAYGVINRYNSFAMSICNFFMRVTEPALRPIRRVVPPIGGFDISPIILLIAIYFLEVLIEDDLAPYLLRPGY